MGGSSTKKIKDIQVVGLNSSAGNMRKGLRLEAAKRMPNGGLDAVRETTEQQIVQMKSLYNDGYLTAMGYNPSESVNILKLSETNILNYTKANIDSNAENITSVYIGSISEEDKVLIALQDNPDFDAATKSFTHTDGFKYLYLSFVRNAYLLDITTYKNWDDTVPAILNTTYPDGYTVLSHSETVVANDGVYNWNTTIEYQEEEEQIIDGVPTQVLVTKTAVVLTPPVYLNIEAVDTEYTTEKAIVEAPKFQNQTMIDSGCYTELTITESDGITTNEYEENCARFVIEYSTTYHGSGNFSVHLTVVSASSDGNYLDNQPYALANVEAAVRELVNDELGNSLRKVVWRYSVGDSIKLAYLASLDHPELYAVVSASAMPIIPLKRNFKFVNTARMDLILKQIGIEDDDLKSSLADKEIRDAALTFGIDSTATDTGSIAYAFEYFIRVVDLKQYYENLSGGFTPFTVKKSAAVSFEAFKIEHSYTTETDIVPGQVRPVGTYWSEGTTRTEIFLEPDSGDNGGYLEVERTFYKPVYCKQESPDYYVRISCTSIGASITIASTKKKYDDYTDQIRYPIIKDVHQLLPMHLYTDVLELSMQFVFRTQIERTIKWHQKGWFKFIVIVVITYFTAGYATLEATTAMSATMAVAGAVVSVAGILGIDTGTVGQIIGIASILYGGYNALTSSTMSAGSQTMVLASSTLSMVNMVNQYYFEKDMAKLMSANKKAQQEAQKERDALEEETDKYINGGLYSGPIDRPVNGYYELALGNLDQYTMMYNQAYDYDRFYS